LGHKVLGETIAAIATPPGNGGVGIVRVSGPLAASVAHGVLGGVPTARYAKLATFRAMDGSAIDQGIGLFFQAPKSFTGEDVLELQGHGGPVVMDLVLERCLELGARAARPGEFTERAFLNGKLDLTQAEAVADLIDSATQLGARLAARSLQGVFSRQVGDLIESLIEVRAYLEATLDFPEDDLGSLPDSPVAADLDGIIAACVELLEQAHQGERIRSGLRVVIAGPPNAGKSCLLNALAQSDAAIVSSSPGTTRDVLKVDIQVEGLPVHLVDTAGIRDTAEPVEQEGVRRARGQMAQADLILWVYDGVVGLRPGDLSDLPSAVPVVLVRNKIDMAGARNGGAGISGYEALSISAMTGSGLAELRAYLGLRGGARPSGEAAFMARRRHLDALKQGLQCLHTARATLQTEGGSELVALELQEAHRAFGEITGVYTPDDLLGRIFSSFCIGK
jgi:tRNA modification GTPase